MAHSSPPPGLWSGPVGFLGELKAFACLVDPTPWARPRLADLFSFHEPRPTAVEPCTICQAVPHPTDWPGSSPATLETWPSPSSRDLQNWTKKQRKRAQQTEDNPETKAGRHFNETKEMQPKQNNGKTCPGPGQQKDRDNTTQSPRNQGKEGAKPRPQNQRTPDTRHSDKTWRKIEREKDKDETHNGPGTSGKPRQTKTKPAP